MKTLLDNAHPLGRYVGIDVSEPVIGWLKEQVTDLRFEFHHLNAHNDLYNPNGTPLNEFPQLPTDLRAFDLICLFSVFTHLAPDDYVAMLHLLRRHVRPDGRLVFSAFLNDPDNPSLLTLALEAALASLDPAVVAQAEQAIANVPSGEDRRFVDEVPEQPLLVARYDKDFALELIEGTGWEVDSIDPPNEHIQFAIVCHPI